MLNLVLVGLNHRTAGIEIRERAAFRLDQIADALKQLTGRPSIQEAMIISTCNRVELLSHVDNTTAGIDSLECFLSETSRLDRHQLQQKTYQYLGDQAVRHLFRVASSLDSMILGEPQILGQVKSFYSVAVDTRTVGFYLNTLLQAAFRAAKRVRSETSIGEYSVSVSSAAVELGRKVFGDLRNRSILIIGAGKMGEIAARHLADSGASRIRVTNRSPEAARELAGKIRGTDVPFDRLVSAVAQSDIVIVSTGAPEVLVDRATAQQVILERRNQPIVFIDISVPHNVDPEVGAIDNVFCYDIDDLGAVVEANRHERRKEATEAERIVEEEVASFCARIQSLVTTPVVTQLHGRIEMICRMELERYLKKAGPHDAKELAELESMVSRIAAKISHPLITQLRTAYQDPSRQKADLETIKRIFNLQKEAKPGE